MRTKKAMLNMTTSMIYQIVAIICGLITPRLILVTFGSTYNGVVSSATQYLSMINILNIGITGVTRVALYKTLATNDTFGTSRIMKATNNYMRKVAMCLIAYAVALSVLYPFFSHNELSNLQCTTLILIVSIGTFAQYFFGLSNQTLLQAAQSSYVTYILDICKTIINTICVAILIHLGSSIYVVKLGSSIIFFITPLIMHLYVRKKFNLTSKCEPDDAAIKNRGAAAFHTVANIIHNDTDLVLLTLFADAKLISVYTVYYLVVGKVKSLMQVFTSGMEAAFGDMWVKKEIDTLQKRFRTYEYMLYSFTAIVFSCVAVLLIPFIQVYTSGVTDVEYVRIPLAMLITAAEGMYCIRQPYLTLVYATGSYEETKNGALIEALLNLGISIVLLWAIGIEGVIIGTLVANVFRTIQFAVYISKHILNRSISNVVYRFIWFLGCLFTVGVITSLLNNVMVFPVTWLGWIINAIVVLAISIVVTGIASLLFYRDDFMDLMGVLLRAIKH